MKKGSSHAEKLIPLLYLILICEKRINILILILNIIKDSIVKIINQLIIIIKSLILLFKGN